MSNLIVDFKLLPGLLNTQITEQLIQLTINEYKWLKPTKYGHIDSDIKITSSSFNIYKEELVKLYQENDDLCISRGNDYLIITPDALSFLGDIFYTTAKNKKRILETSFISEIFNTISLVKSPVVVSAAEEMYDEFETREIQRDSYTEETYTLKDYTHGLKNAYWRMWFGKEYIDFFGKEKLDNAPAFYKHYENDIYFIQLFESPYDWDSPAGIEAAENFKDVVGRESFYDPDDPEKKLKAPDFSHLLK